MKVHVTGGHTLSSRGIGNPRPPTPALTDNPVIDQTFSSVLGPEV